MTASMVDESAPQPSRRRHIARLAVFAGFLLLMYYLVGVERIVDIEQIRHLVRETGPAAPLTYAVSSAVLGALFVPGSLLATGSGIIFGPALGIVVTLGAAVGTAIVANRLGNRAGRDSARALIGDTRSDRIDAIIERRGLWAVVGQHFIPGLSSALASYAFGAFGVPLWQAAIGTLIGSVPRAFAYTALGASIADHSRWLATAAIAVWCASAAVGAVAAHQGYRTWRAHGRHEAHAEPEAD
jgi:uncharacterized membrane protein YdjX (TVP38/TMEM64 family)